MKLENGNCGHGKQIHAFADPYVYMNLKRSVVEAIRLIQWYNRAKDTSNSMKLFQGQRD